MFDFTWPEVKIPMATKLKCFRCGYCTSASIAGTDGCPSSFLFGTCQLILSLVFSYNLSIRIDPCEITVITSLTSLKNALSYRRSNRFSDKTSFISNAAARFQERNQPCWISNKAIIASPCVWLSPKICCEFKKRLCKRYEGLPCVIYSPD